ncbi:MFS transporter [Sphingobium sp. TKS]|uniref:MFS transporter n=1 Tax=Sphingobium sp. TKS TaxID=1315974 RepID=UPI0013145EB4|nr:MFS transporter [Sphingobium sp. TKS]NML90455.1 MFS transporter [Sphingobium sp. TB-6]
MTRKGTTPSPSGQALVTSPVRTGGVMLVGAALFMEMLDGSILTTALPSMAPEFGVAPVQLKMAITGYLLAVAICIPMSDWLGRRVGGRRLFMAALALFGATSAACMASPNLGFLVMTRIVQGVAGAMMVPVGRLLVLRDLPKGDLVRIIAMLTWPALLAPAIAPPLSGLVVEYASWRWLFAINIPFCLTALALAPWLLPRLPPERPVSLDFAGLALWVALATMLVLVLGDATRLGPLWTGVAVCGTAAIAHMLWRHLRRADHPLLDLTLLRDRSFAHALRGGSGVRIAIFANPFLLPLMMQLGLGLSPVDTGMLMLIATMGNIGLKPFTTPLMHRFSYRSILLVNGLLLSVGFGLFAFLDKDTPRLILIALLVGTGMARSLHFSALNTLAFRTVPSTHMPVANMMFSAVMQMNAALGVAMSAMALQLWPELAGSGHGDDMAPFRFAFALVAICTLAGVLDVLKLEREARSTQPLAEIP